jgi:hypothetical protein
MLRSTFLIGMLGVPLAACGDAPDGPALPATASNAARTPQSDAPAAGVAAKRTLSEMVESAVVAAAEKTGLARSELKVVSADAVVWADGSIGCAEPGMNYTMALVRGYRIIIDAQGETLDYHATERGYLLLCPPGRSAGTAREETR